MAVRSIARYVDGDVATEPSVFKPGRLTLSENPFPSNVSGFAIVKVEVATMSRSNSIVVPEHAANTAASSAEKVKTCCVVLTQDVVI